MSKTIREQLIEQGLIKPASPASIVPKKSAEQVRPSSLSSRSKRRAEKMPVDPYCPPLPRDGVNNQLFWLARLHPFMRWNDDPEIERNWKKVSEDVTYILGKARSESAVEYRRGCAEIIEALRARDCYERRDLPRQIFGFFPLSKAEAKELRTLKKLQKPEPVQRRSVAVMSVGKGSLSRWRR